MLILFYIRPVTQEDATSGSDVDNAIKFLVADIAQFQKDVQNLRSHTKQIGSAKDTITLREKMYLFVYYINRDDEFNRTSSSIKGLTDKMKSINKDIYNIRDAAARVLWSIIISIEKTSDCIQ